MILSFLKNILKILTIKTESYYLQNSFNASLRPTALAGVIAKLDNLQGDTASDKIGVGYQVKLVNMQDQQEYQIELVYPPKHKPCAGRFSVISDLGASLLGLSKGEMAQVNILGKPVLFMITQVTSNKKARTTTP
ncbi:GreA/GreB family elongation factor [Shewanella algidipiscicola]|uniref:GreA/GreB family elongation factor n=1 Tax=Shewanella algidipiscicola TaxID=614070 RepID=UPI000D7866A2|nr:GreA/GreB family elongation factor [Shewanella algidipiscicola]